MRGYSGDKDGYLKRLRRIEGQIRGLQRMVESDEYCIDVLTQVSAATKALQAFALGLLDEHMNHCVSDALTGPDHDQRARRSDEEAAMSIGTRSEHATHPAHPGIEQDLPDHEMSHAA